MAQEKSKGIGFNAPQSVGTPMKNYVLAIAIDDYSAQPLHNCVRDAEAFTQKLLQYQGFEAAQIKILANDRASRTAVIREIREYSNRLTESDNFILYFSGHGIIDAIDKEGYWLLYGCDLHNYYTEGINNQDIMRNIRSMKARHILLLVDSCFSGSLFYSVRGGDAPPPDVRDRFASRWAITAGRQEIVSDGQYGGHSPFANYLIRFLDKKDHPNGRFSVTELATFIKTSVARNANQIPDGRSLQNAGDEGGEFIFYLKAYDHSDLETTQGNIPETPDRSPAAAPANEPEPVVAPKYTAQYEEIRQHIAKANLEAALKILVAIHPDAVVLQQSFATSKRENMMGLLTHDEWARTRNQIAYRILEMMQ